MAPEGWRRAQLSEVADLILGQSPPSAEVSEIEAGFPFLQGNAQFGERHPHATTWVAAPPRTAPPESTLVSVRAPVGDVNRADVEYGIGRGLAAVTARSRAATQEYVFWVLANAQPYFDSRKQGSTFDAINKTDLLELPILLPSLPEQRKIAAILSSVDDAIAATRKVIEQTKRVKRGLLQTLMTRGIGHTRLKKTVIGEIPEVWEISRMEALAVPGGMVGGPFGSDLTASDYMEGSGVPVIRGGNVSPGRFHRTNFVYVDRAKAEQLKRNQAVPGDLIMTQRGASFGQTALLPEDASVVRFVVSQTMMRMRPDRNRVQPEFLLHYINSDKGQNWLRRKAIATGQPHLNLTIFRRMPVPVPAMNEQEQITNAVRAIEEAENSGSEELDGLAKLKRGLMQDLLTGRVRVHPD